VLTGVAACGDSSPASSSGTVASSTTADPGVGPAVTAEPEAEPVLPVALTDETGESVTVDDVSRIIPVNGDVAEVVFALGLGDRVVATDLSATYPPEADARPEIGYQRALVAETILAHEPTVVIGDSLAGPPGALDEVRAVDVPVVITEYPRDVDGAARKIRAIATALGVPGRGELLARETEAAIASARDEADALEGDGPPVAFLYLRGEDVQQIAGAGSGISALITDAGAIDIGTELDVDEFAPLGAEALIEAQPDVIVVTTSGLESVGGIDGLVELPAVAGTPAGRERRILAYEDQLVLGLGPRTGEFLHQLVDDLHD
jgi:iron complex transport system substrate-binding protein